MSGAPIQTVFGNVVLARDAGDAWAVFRVRCRSYRSEPRRKQRALVEQLEAFCAGVEADFQILRVSRRWDAGRVRARTAGAHARRAHRELWRGHLESPACALSSSLSPGRPRRSSA